MIFDVGPSVFESEKERNLYYKVFAGYVFNEFIDGAEQRLKKFCSWVESAPVKGKAARDLNLQLTPETTHASFDNHAYLFGGLATDNGEWADVLVHDKSTRTVIAIEAKVHSDWSYKKDVLSNEARLRVIEEQMDGATVVPCLLVKKGKWEAVESQRNHPSSQYREFIEREDNRSRVLFWEDLAAEVVQEEAVRTFIHGVLSHPRDNGGYGFSDGWFVRQ